MSDVPLGRFACQVMIDPRYIRDGAYEGHLERELSYAKENLIRATLDKLPEDQPFVFRYKRHVQAGGYFRFGEACDHQEVHTLELEIEPVDMMRVTMEESRPIDYYSGHKPTTDPESFWDKAKSWYAGLEEGVKYVG